MLSALLLFAHSGAAEELGPILLSYRAEPGCPEVAEFQRGVERRSSHVHFVDEGSHERELSIRLSRQGDFMRGELRLIEKDGRMRQRSVRFTTCAEAVDGLALITAVSLDPHAQLQPLSPSTPSASPTSPRPTPRPAPAPTQSSPAQSSPAQPRTQRSLPPGTAPSVARRTADSAPGLELAVGAQFEGSPQLLPAAAFGAGLFIDVGSRQPGWFAPLLRLAFSHVQRRSISEPGFDANFALTQASLSLCPLKLGTTSWVLRPCAFASAGVLRAWGSNTSEPSSGQTAFGAWGLSGSLGVPLTSRLELALSLAGAATLTRDRYVFDQTLVWSTPVLYLWGGLGLRFVIQ